MSNASAFFFVEHSIHFADGTHTARYRLVQTWKTVKGALRAGERFVAGIDKHYDNIAFHSLVVRDANGSFITNEAA